MIVGEAFPIVSTPDLERMLGFYRDLLGARLSTSFRPDNLYMSVSGWVRVLSASPTTQKRPWVSASDLLCGSTWTIAMPPSPN